MGWEKDPSTDFGLPKSNFKPVVNPTTDLDASEYEEVAVTLAGYTMAADKAWVAVSAGTAASTSGQMLKAHGAIWGNTSTVAPTVARASTGSYTITWATSYTDINPTPARVSTAAVNLEFASVSPTSPPAAVKTYLSHISVSTNVASIELVGVWASDGTIDPMDFNFYVAVK